MTGATSRVPLISQTKEHRLAVGRAKQKNREIAFLTGWVPSKIQNLKVSIPKRKSKIWVKILVDWGSGGKFFGGKNHPQKVKGLGE